MGKTRVHLLAKELGIETKDLIAQLDKLGMRGRKAQSALEDDEVARIRAALAAHEKPQVHVGAEKVVVDRMVKAEEEGQGGVDTHETIVERRVRANVIRRRVNRVEVAPTEPAPVPAAAEASHAPVVEEETATHAETVTVTEPAAPEVVPETAVPEVEPAPEVAEPVEPIVES